MGWHGDTSLKRRGFYIGNLSYVEYIMRLTIGPSADAHAVDVADCGSCRLEFNFFYKGISSHMRRQLQLAGSGSAVLAALLMSWSAHAANPIADEKIAVAQASLQRAEQSGAPQSAPVELATARDKLARAQKANVDRDYKIATALAEQANIDAQVAEAAAAQQRSHAAALEFDASMQALRAESMRATAPAQ